MPLKPVFSRSPILTVPYCFPASGTVRTSDERIRNLYQKANQYIDKPCLWEGLFRLACLTKNKPLEEPVANLILRNADVTESGAFSGNISDQTDTARAILALFEYNTDKTLLKRLADWLRYFEIEYDNLILQDGVLFRPADLMEFLVRFYRASGVKSALRLCARLRADSFDWTTALHTFQQSIPLTQNETEMPDLFFGIKPDMIEYDQKERLINHSELLADGVRYSVYAGIYSGHNRDLSAGQTVWPYLLKHHHALCGCVTGNPYLSGNASDQTISNRTLCAWTEAFASQMAVSESPWAVSELIRIIYNGLDDCLNCENITETQRINSVSDHNDPPSDPAKLYSRLCRAVAAVCSHAVSMNENGIRINYPLPGKYLIMIRKQSIMLCAENDTITVQCKKPVDARIEVFLPATGTGYAVTAGKDGDACNMPEDVSDNQYICLNTSWENQDMIRYVQNGRIYDEETHHHGFAFMKANRLLSMPVSDTGFARAVCDLPVINERNQIMLPTEASEKWTLKGPEPADIPVYPETKGPRTMTELITYSDCRKRITMFPRKRS